MFDFIRKILLALSNALKEPEPLPVFKAQILFQDKRILNSPFLSSLFEAMYEAGILNRLSPLSLEGCSEEQLLKAQTEQNVDYLPEVYRQFMQVIGDSSNDLKLVPPDDNCGCEYVGSNKEVAQEFLSDNNSRVKLHPDAFIFSMIIPYGFTFFLTADKEDDPIVYQYDRHHDAVIMVTNRLSTYYETCVEARAQLFKK